MPRGDEARASDGTRICYKVWGPSRPERRLTLIHSLAMDGGFWSGVAAALGEEWEILAVDCRGHGRSGKPAGPYTVELFADDLAAAMDREGWETSMVGGASMGGCVALAFAALHARRVAGLALIDTTAHYGPNAPQTWERRAQKALDDGMSALVDFQKTRWFSDAFREEHPRKVDAAIEVFLANDVTAYAETCRMLGRCDQRDVLDRVDVPVEVVVGEEDYATPIEMAKAMADRFANATLTVLPDARHFTPLEVPEQVATRVSRLFG